jgi:hypothetical protein
MACAHLAMGSQLRSGIHVGRRRINIRSTKKCQHDSDASGPEDVNCLDQQKYGAGKASHAPGK